MTLFMVATLISTSALPAFGEIDLLYDPVDMKVRINDLFYVDVVARSSTTSPEQLTALDAIISWDSSLVELVGFDLSRSPHSWTNWGFLADICGVNDGIDDPPLGIPANDGAAVYTAWGNVGNPPSVGPEGLIVTTLEFRALAPTTTAIGYLVDVTVGEQTCATQVLGEGIGNDVTGDIAATCAVAVVAEDIPTVSEWGFGVLALLLLSAGTIAIERRRASG
jgi:hypothetical protein